LDYDCDFDLEDIENQFASEDEQFEPVEQQVLINNEILNEQPLNLTASNKKVNNITNIPFVESHNDENSIKWDKFIPIEKRNIIWEKKPFSPQVINLTPITEPIYPTTIPNPIDYFSKYFCENDFANMAKYTNLYSEQKKLK
jgi:hypothetical protein